MSQQNDDEGTVIRPTTTSAGAPGVASPSFRTEPARPFESGEDNLSLHVGAHVGEFEITRRIGEGGFSIVYLALDHSLERTVALKEYMPSSLATRVGTTLVQPRSQRHRDTFEAGLKSFVNEAKLLAQFDHPSLVKVYRFWEANGTAYMVMPYYQGITVKDAVRAMPAPPDEAWLLTLLGPLTEALLVIHAEHCYHRDIAPDNVILLANSAKPLLLDFGAARRVIGDMTQGLTVILKSGYAPVEQYAEVPGMKQGSWTDVYALAAVVYWAVTGSTPPASVGRMLSDSFVPLSQCAAGRYSTRFLQAIDRALILRPEQRTPSIDAFREDVGLSGGAPPAAAWMDPEATIIRPSARGPMRTATQPPPSDARLEAARTAQPMRSAPAVPPTIEQAERAEAFEQAERASALGSVSAPASVVADQKPAGARRGLLIASVAGTVAIVAAGAWWTYQFSSSESPNPATGSTAPIASDRAPATSPAQQVISDQAPAATQPTTPPTPEPVVAAPTPSSTATEPPTTSSPLMTAEPRTPVSMPSSATASPDIAAIPRPSTPPVAPVEPSPPVVLEAAKPVPAATLSSSEHVPDTAPSHAKRRPSTADTAEARPEPRTQRTATPATVQKPESTTASGADEAECVRIFQRLSLGESNPALLNRLKTLKCR